MARRFDKVYQWGRLTTRKYLSAEHVMVASMGTQGRSVVDDLLAEQGLERRVARKTSSFWSAPSASRLPASANRADDRFRRIVVGKDLEDRGS